LEQRGLSIYIFQIQSQHLYRAPFSPSQPSHPIGLGNSEQLHILQLVYRD
jgi:hypothetical protein